METAGDGYHFDMLCVNNGKHRRRIYLYIHTQVASYVILCPVDWASILYIFGPGSGGLLNYGLT